MNTRLYPPKSRHDFYHLTELRKTLELLISEYLSEKKNLMLLDYGCGKKPYESLFNGITNNYIGIDFVNEKLQKYVDVPLSKEYSLPFKDCSFDIVLSSQVIEHVTSPSFYIKECNRVLKNGGFLILSTHGMWKYHPVPTDFWRWTYDGLKRSIEIENLVVLKLIGSMGLLSYSIQLFQDEILRKKLNKYKNISKPFIRLCQFIIAKVDKKYDDKELLENASTYILIALKN